MQRNQLNDITVFVEVARCNGFRAAAEKLKIGPGAVSEAIQRFEDRLGVRLFDRSTRNIALTSVGEKLYLRSLPAIDDLTNAILELDERPDLVSGKLRLNAPRSAGAFFLDELLGNYSATYPDVKIELTYNDKKVNLFESRIDAAIRAETLLEPNTYALPIGPDMPMTVVASADYLKVNGTPKHPDELAQFDGVCFALEGPDNLASWQFKGANGLYSVMPKPRIVVNDFSSMLHYTKAGLGLTYTYAKPIERLIQQKRLIPILKGHIPSQPKFTINYVSKRHMPARLRAFIELAKQIC